MFWRQSFNQTQAILEHSVSGAGTLFPPCSISSLAESGRATSHRIKNVTLNSESPELVAVRLLTGYRFEQSSRLGAARRTILSLKLAVAFRQMCGL
jgi:hypothetical protein